MQDGNYSRLELMQKIDIKREINRKKLMETNTFKRLITKIFEKITKMIK